MKKFGLMLMACALVLGMTQCKKKDAASNAVENGLYITLNAGVDGDKSGFNPANGSFVWSKKTEYIYVGGSTSGYLGELTGDYSASQGNPTATRSFAGNITNPENGETLYFFYLGNGRHLSGSSAVTELDFSNQLGDLDHLTNYHVAIGSAQYESGQTTYDATLEMKTAFAYFDLNEFFPAYGGSGDVTIFEVDSDSGMGEIEILDYDFPATISGTGIFTKAKINYKSGTITPKYPTGSINITDIGNKYIGLIPSTESTTTINFACNPYYTGSMEFVNGIRAGRYYSTNGNALKVTANPSSEIQSIWNDFCEQYEESYFDVEDFFRTNLDEEEEKYKEIGDIIGDEGWNVPDYIYPLQFIDYPEDDAWRVLVASSAIYVENQPYAMLLGFESEEGAEWYVYEGTGQEDGSILMELGDEWLNKVIDGRPVCLFIVSSI